MALFKQLDSTIKRLLKFWRVPVLSPCLYVKNSAKGIVYIALYVDNNLMMGDIATIDDAIEALKNKGMILKIVEGLHDYLSCEIIFSDDKKHAWLGQPHLIKNLENKFQGLVHEVQSHKTASTPKFLILRPMEENKKITTEDQQDNWLGEGMLLYLFK